MQFVITTSLSDMFCSKVTLFLGAVAKLPKATITFIMSVRLSVCPPAWNNSAITGRIFMKFDNRSYFENLSRSSSY
jgi:hypothetical protein